MGDGQGSMLVSPPGSSQFDPDYDFAKHGSCPDVRSAPGKSGVRVQLSRHGLQKGTLIPLTHLKKPLPRPQLQGLGEPFGTLEIQIPESDTRREEDTIWRSHGTLVKVLRCSSLPNARINRLARLYRASPC